jgi:hypothetical protein
MKPQVKREIECGIDGKRGWPIMTLERVEEIDCPKYGTKQTETFYETINVTLNFLILLLSPTRPRSPVPRRSMVAGSGTATPAKFPDPSV